MAQNTSAPLIPQKSDGSVQATQTDSTFFQPTQAYHDAQALPRDSNFGSQASGAISSGHTSSNIGFDMRNVASALPDYNYRPYQQATYQQQYHPSNPSHGNTLYTFPGPQYAGQTAGNYYAQYDQQYPAQSYTYPRPYLDVHGVGATSHGQQQFQNHPNAAQQQQQMMQNQFAAPSLQYPQMYPQATGLHHPHPPPYLPRAGSGMQVPQLRVDNYNIGFSGYPPYTQHEPSVLRRNSSSSSVQASSALRGPPRKPKQSGHALWVGNLPPGTHIINLKDHFSRDATEDIESVFLISKSNCAFVNYRSEQSCAAAMTRFHDSRFHGVRLVCRLRRGNSSGPESGSLNVSPGASTSAHGRTSDDLNESSKDDTNENPSASERDEIPQQPKEKLVEEKFFIVKSLTMEDLERSVISGTWATQAHNEISLNRAFQTAENVYLIFSANKSGEYFGYARMESAISDEAAASIEVPIPETKATTSMATSVPDVPLTIPTPATATAPKGHIIDDSARGTIFWEADTGSLTPSSARESGEEETSGEDSVAQQSPSVSTQQSTIGKPFRVKWVSTERLPFYRTRGLRNAWNTNREVKIARDGTELEPGVGRKLVSMFGQVNLPRGPMQQQQQLRHMSGAAPPYGYGQPVPGPSFGRSY